MHIQKKASLNKQALIGKGVAVKWLQNILKNTVKSGQREAFLQGARGMAGNHPLTQAGRYLKEKVGKLPQGAKLKDVMDKFITRPQKLLDWAPKAGKDRIKKGLYNSQGNIKQLLDRLSRRTMWTPTYRDEKVKEVGKWLTNHLHQLGEAKRSLDPNYNSVQYWMNKARELFK